MNKKRLVAVLIFILLFVWFMYNNILPTNIFNIEPFKEDIIVLRNIRAIGTFFAYLSFSFLPFILKSDGIFRFLKYFVILLPATILIFIVGPSDAMFAPDESDVAIGLALLHIPVALFAMFREHRAEKLTDK